MKTLRNITIYTGLLVALGATETYAAGGIPTGAHTTRNQGSFPTPGSWTIKGKVMVKRAHWKSGTSAVDVGWRDGLIGVYVTSSLNGDITAAKWLMTDNAGNYSVTFDSSELDSMPTTVNVIVTSDPCLYNCAWDARDVYVEDSEGIPYAKVYSLDNTQGELTSCGVRCRRASTIEVKKGLGDVSERALWLYGLASYVVDKFEGSANWFRHNPSGRSLPSVQIVYDESTEWCTAKSTEPLVTMSNACLNFYVVAHELGHTAMNDAWGFAGRDSSWDKVLCTLDEAPKSCGSHDVNSIKHGFRAFTEGWAEFIGDRMVDYLVEGPAHWKYRDVTNAYGRVTLAGFGHCESRPALSCREDSDCSTYGPCVGFERWNPSTEFCTGVSRCRVYAASHGDSSPGGVTFDSEDQCCADASCMTGVHAACSDARLGYKASLFHHSDKRYCPDSGSSPTAGRFNYAWNREGVIRTALVNLHDDYNEQDSPRYGSHYLKADNISMTMAELYAVMERLDSDDLDRNFRGFARALRRTYSFPGWNSVGYNPCATGNPLYQTACELQEKVEDSLNSSCMIHWTQTYTDDREHRN